ncbi:hypothetical protein CI610_01164 [invertebrate metagenome]|uniref:YHS domain-containing protein n=1 Tax=invertebrate metagenome TaxID=1711999 RepID=A0A2H9T9C4_9ZZZZ
MSQGMSVRKKLLHLWVSGLLIIGVSFNAWGNGSIYTGWLSNKAVSGYDPVAYFTEGEAIKGKPDFIWSYQGADWYFSSKKHMKLFKSDPEKYSPQYGGHCAWAIAVKGRKVAGDPIYWTIVKDKLFLNYNQSTQKKWRSTSTQMIRDGDKNWAAQ